MICVVSNVDYMSSILDKLSQLLVVREWYEEQKERIMRASLNRACGLG